MQSKKQKITLLCPVCIFRLKIFSSFINQFTMLSESGRMLAPQLSIPEIADPDDTIPPRYCPWLSRCRSGNFWSYPANTIRGIPVDNLELLEKLANLQPMSRDASDAKYDSILRYSSSITNVFVRNFPYRIMFRFFDRSIQRFSTPSAASSPCIEDIGDR